MIFLNNGILALTIDDQCRLTQLESMKENTGNLIHSPASLFRAVLKTGENWEDVVYAADAEYELSQTEDTGVITVRALHTRMGRQPVAMELRIRLADDRLFFDAVIDNHSDSTVVDFYYPCVGAIDQLGGEAPGLLLPLWFGEYHTDIIGELRGSAARDGRYELTETYPGNMGMQWMTLMGGGMSLYLGSHDSQFHTTAFRTVCPDANAVVMEIDKMAFAQPGKRWEAPAAVLWLYRGSWQPGAEAYRDWANATWRRQVEPKKWIKDMTGYLLVINKQQYGDILWPYEQIPALYDLAQEYGFNTLGLFGWFETGHDNGYPDLEVSATMGGEQKLRDGIQNVQDRGGYVTLYYQGHLIDVTSPFYKEHGDEVEVKSRWNTPYYEQYNKFTHSNFLRSFTRKTFSAACPHSSRWQDLMAQKADWIHSFGANGVLYDQLGGRPSLPCFSTRHGHDNPSTAYAQGRVQLLERIRRQADTHHEYAFMTEMLTDVYAQQIDCIHGWRNHQDVKGSRTGLGTSKRPRVVLASGVMRHTFPEVRSTVRNYRPFIDPRTVNHCLCYGLRMEMELRTLQDLEYIRNDPHPEWRAYAKAASQLARKHADLLLNGTYHCDADLCEANPELHVGRFTADGQECIVMWNDTDKDLPIHLAGHTASRWENPEASGEGVPQTLAADQLIVLF